MTDKERVGEVLKFSKMSQSKFAKCIKVSQSTLFMVLDHSKPNKPGMSIIKGILELYPTLNPAWLIQGKDEMWLPEKGKKETIESLKQQISAYQELIRRDMPEVAKRLGLLD